jgi:hypothetical protein
MLMLCATGMAYPGAQARFEHVFTVLDAETAAAVADSGYLRDFSGLQAKTISSDEGHYHGLYISGRENFLELFGPADLNLDEKTPTPVGQVGIGLNVEQIDGLLRMKPLVEKNGVPVVMRTFHKSLGGRSVDWFKGLGPPSVMDGGVERSTLPQVEIFAAEFIPSYFDVPEANKPPSMGPDDVVSLARYHRRDFAGRLLNNITAVTLAITRDDWPTVRAMLVAAGYRISELRAGARATGDIVLSFQFVPRRQVGLRRVDFGLTSSPGIRHVEVLGHSRLEVGPRAEAVWTFEPRQAD